MMRTVLIALVAALLGACSARSQQQGQGDAVATECRGNLPKAARTATASVLTVTQAYASAGPEILELTLTGAVRTGTIIFKGVDDRPAFSGVPRDLRRQLRPLGRAFDTIRRATRAHIRTLESLRDAAEACSETAREADQPCLESAATELARSAEATIRLARRNLAIEGGLRHLSDDIESASRRLEQEGINLSQGMFALERCPM